MQDFRDKVVWITGAASGIGAAVARAFAAAGARVVLSDRDAAGLDATLQSLGGAGGAMVLPFDVIEFDRHAALAAEVKARMGRIDLLFNIAGITQRSLVRDTGMDVYRRLMDVDYFAPVSLTKAVLPIMVADGGGGVAVVSSVAGKFGTALRSGYCAAKHALHGFFDSLRAEAWADNIHVTIVVPASVRTNVSVNALRGDGSRYGVMDAAMAQGQSADEAAAIILKAMQKGAPEIVVGNGIPIRMLRWKRLWSPKRFFKLMQTAKTT